MGAAGWRETMKQITIAERMAAAEAAEASDLVLCESADGWSLHAPGSSDDEIAAGDASYLVCGEGDHPTAADYSAALRVLVERAAQ